MEHAGPAVRLATVSDVSTFVRIWVDATTARERALGIRPVTEAKDVEQFMRERLARSRTYALLLEDLGRPTAISVSMPARENDGAGPGEVPALAHLSMVAVDPARWDEGFGTRIVVASIEEGRARGLHRVQLWTQEANARAQHVYRRLGFEPTGRTKVDDVGELIGHWVRESSPPGDG